MSTVINDQIMHALELASEASERAGKWATPPEVTAFGRTGEVNLNRTINTDDLNALVQEGRAESKTVYTGYEPMQAITSRQMLYRPQPGGSSVTLKARKSEGSRKPNSPLQEETLRKGPREGLSDEELFGDIPKGSLL